MKKYDKLIEDTKTKIEVYKSGNKGHTAETTQSNLNQLLKAIKKGDEKAAEAAAEKLSEMKKVEIHPPAEDVVSSPAPDKKKNGKN